MDGSVDRTSSGGGTSGRDGYVGRPVMIDVAMDSHGVWWMVVMVPNVQNSHDVSLNA